jgi:ABC-type Mn2+/Zn2+ transport system permease subunit
VEFLTDPVSWWVDPLVDHAFVRDVVWSGLLAVVCTSVVGTWVVLRGMSFLGDALAHGVLPGVAIAFVVGGSTTVGAFVAALAMVGGISLIRVHSPLPEDTSIGVLFVGFLALAVVIMSSHSGSYAGDLNSYLFGSLTGVTHSDLIGQAVAAAVTLAGVAVFHRAFLVMTFDETQAQLLGLRPRLAHAALLVLLALSIVASFRAVGNLLVFAFLIAPPGAAALLVRRVPRIMALAVLLGSVAVVLGAIISFHLESATGATMALVAVAIFLAALTGRSVSDAFAQRAGALR